MSVVRQWNIDAVVSLKDLYAKGKMARAALRTRDYPNMYGDLSAGSGSNPWTRDEDHAGAFLAWRGIGTSCFVDRTAALRAGASSGAWQIAVGKRLAPGAKAVRKMRYENAGRVLKIG